MLGRLEGDGCELTCEVELIAGLTRGIAGASGCFLVGLGVRFDLLAKRLFPQPPAVGIAFRGLVLFAIGLSDASGGFGLSFGLEVTLLDRGVTLCAFNLGAA